MDDPMAELSARPTLEQALARYEQMQQRIFDTLSAELGPFVWQRISDGIGAGCGEDFPPGSPGQTKSLPLWGFEANIPDERWPRAVRLIADISDDYGFSPPTVLADRPGQHDIFASDGYGGNYQFGTEVNTSWQVATGCHRPATASRQHRGTHDQV